MINVVDLAAHRRRRCLAPLEAADLDEDEQYRIATEQAIAHYDSEQEMLHRFIGARPDCAREV